MRNIKFLLFTILPFMPEYNFAQTKQFAPIGATWYYDGHGSFGELPSPHSYFKYQSLIDTIVAGQECKKISITHFEENGNIREEAPLFVFQSNNVVYYYNTIYSRFLRLYDFNVLRGETTFYRSPEDPKDLWDTIFLSTVDSITNFIVGNDTLKRFWTNEFNGYKFGFTFDGGYIEKIGSPILMMHQYNVKILGHGHKIRCYTDSSIHVNFTAAPCDYWRPLSNSSNIALFNSILYPNPASNYINLRMDASSPYRYKLINSLGKIIVTGDGFSQELTISLIEFPKGPYSLIIERNNHIEQKVFIKI